MNIVLVHGSYHGAWCWDLMKPALARLGHSVTAVELPISNPTAGASAYAEAIVAQVDWSEPPVLIGHSMSGLVIPLVAARRETRHMIFLCAFLPRPGMSANDQRQQERIDPEWSPQTSEWSDLGDGVWMVGPETAQETFFQDLSPDLAKWAVDRLRPQSYRVMTEVTPLVEWPVIRSDYIVCSDDRAINAEWGRHAAEDRLGVRAVELEGGHSPFLSRPVELASLLDSLIRKDERSTLTS